jgi:hypothetical protein
VLPFALDSPAQFPVGPPPALDAEDYRRAYMESECPSPSSLIIIIIIIIIIIVIIVNMVFT